MQYEEWLVEVPEAIARDGLWRLDVYRQALFIGDLARYDVEKIAAQRQWWSLADQLFRAAGSINANIAEGYSRPTSADRTRFYSYALGSARETRDWYFKARHLLGPEVVQHRLGLLTHIIRQLINLQKHHKRNIREAPEAYPSE